jgi:aryl-alcohol dehydrogenase-like predicted oxidoreductase
LSGPFTLARPFSYEDASNQDLLKDRHIIIHLTIFLQQHMILNYRLIQSMTNLKREAIILKTYKNEMQDKEGEYKMNERIVFGATGLEVSPICFGTWQLSPRFWGEQSKSDVVAAMNIAYDAGINFFDTADAYGDGYAETVLREFLSEISHEKVVICTKVFNHFNPDASRYPDLSPEHIRQRCELQLQRMGIDTIDLYLLHMFDPLTPLADIAETLDSLKKQGKIRSYGVSNHTVEQLRAHRRFGNYNAVQPLYSLIDTEIESDLLPYCEAENIGVMIYSPMHKGLLTGKYTGNETFTDFRKHLSEFQGERFREITMAVQNLGPLAEKYQLTIHQLILAATLMHPSIDVAIVGIKNQSQITEAVGAMGKIISREDYFALRKTLAIDGIKKIQDASGERK